MKPIKSRKNTGLKLPRSILDEIDSNEGASRNQKGKRELSHREKRKLSRNTKNGSMDDQRPRRTRKEERETDDALDMLSASQELPKSKKAKKDSSPSYEDFARKQQLDALGEDDREIAMLEKRLGIRGKKTKRTSQVDKEFGWIIEDLGQDLNDLENDGLLAPHEEEDAGEESVDFEEEPESEESFQGFSEEEDNQENENSNEEQEVESASEEDMEEEKGLKEDSPEDEQVQPQEEPKRQNPYLPAASSTPSTGKYIPPSLRQKTSADDQGSIELTRLRRRLQGLLNRLSGANVGSIVGEIEAIYMENSRHSVTDTLTKLILQIVMARESMLDQLVIVYAALSTALYRIIGPEFGAYLLQSLVDEFLRLYKSKETEPLSSHKETSNLIVFFVELYNFQLVSCILVYDFVRMFLKSLTELNVELLLKIVRNCGNQLRSDDPSALQDIVQEMNLLLSTADPASISVRTKFMVESITSLRENKKAKVAIANSQLKSEAVNQLKKFLGSLNNRSLRATEPLRVSMQDIEQVESKGRWWLVGASWKSDPLVENNIASSSSKITEEKKKNEELLAHSRLLQTAKKLRLNTGIRTSIFIALMGAEDYIDAWDRILKLRLKKVQQPEIAYVILHCASNEKMYNPFYALVALKCCTRQHNLKKSFQFSLWDFFNDLQPEDDGEAIEVPTRKVFNLAKLYAYLLIEGGQPLTILKHVDFMSMNSQLQTFILVFLSDILIGSKEDIQVVQIMDTCKTEKNLSSKVDWFLKTYVRNNPLVEGKEKSLLKSNLSIARAALQTIAKNEA
ncbi:ribosome small subunit biogenesis protein Sgd1 [Schizosaccharomyces osmophilus]|uniref:Ribosome small subunit biogenesis protein Sgd1 n=1 Tax=Schizosaccharomyces osmophilus TaxID=2545709 RepID=A0AAE9W769_9SCHI|nr:ribosome small subunit biogenesis protein Sgd1 [Schizosaccharomyces osmophilus]WBW70705.1 ribosome small subunit biogenesis protein Sgd1 [Schizosaccharomyces osmophilus]